MEKLPDSDEHWGDMEITNCGHMMHSKCLDKWCEENNSCPHCRSEDFRVPKSERTNKRPREEDGDQEGEQIEEIVIE